MIHMGSVLFMRLMKSTASTSSDSAFGVPGKWMTGSPEASLMALAVAARFSLVMPVDPPIRTASLPASSMRLAISPAASGSCLSGSMRAM